MSKAYRRPIAADCDAADSYNAYVRPILLLVGLPVYLAYLAVNVSRTPKIDYGDGTAGYLNSRARDSGLRMEITSPFPESQLITHGVAAVLLFVLIVIQKESVRAMRGAPLRCPNIFSWVGASSDAAMRWHRRIGRCCCVLMVVLAAPGFLLCRHSSWEHFETFSYFFAAPWLCWAAAIYLTATPRLIHTHRFVGNMALKGCIAVPLSRIAGAALQERGWGEERGYYVGIGGVSAVVLLWLVYDNVREALKGSGDKGSGDRSACRGLICLDLDGTLYGADHGVSPVNAAAVGRASRAGYRIALCTGRSLNCHLPTARDLGLVDDLFVVACNGAVVIRQSADGAVAERFFETQLSAQTIDSIAGVLGSGRAQKADVIGRQYYTCSADDDAQRALVEAHSHLERTSPERLDDYAASLKALARAPNKMTVFSSDASTLAAEAAALGERHPARVELGRIPPRFILRVRRPPVPRIGDSHSSPRAGTVDGGIVLLLGGPTWVDTVDVAHDKAAGVRLLCERLGIGLESCVAFGDGANDASMLRAVGLGIAMAQGRDEAKAAADRVSRWRNDEDAVAKEIDALLVAGTST